ncbi:MAG: Sec-independent protein translocase protein TatB [Marinosulfonomonas sp.]|nr:Sec-independent protein translocase protein TatB [Marinosulfonomonas sp.]
MFDIGWTELLVIGVVALIVVGPKDLPGMFRTLGRFTAKARGMAREFSRAMEDAADEAGVKDVAKDLKKMTSAKNLGLDTLKNAAKDFEKWDPLDTPEKSKGPATEALSKERAESAKKIRESAAQKASDRIAAEKIAAAKPATQKKPAAKKPSAKPAAKKAAAKPAGKKAVAKTPAKAAAKPAAKKPRAKKAAK